MIRPLTILLALGGIAAGQTTCETPGQTLSEPTLRLRFYNGGAAPQKILNRALEMEPDPYQAALDRLGRLEAPPHLSAKLKARIAASLPKEGEVKTLTAMQREKLEAVAPVLKAHGREDDYLLKVVESRQARVAIYARSVVLISETALRVLSPTQLQAMVAHEIGHEYVWDEFEEARKKGDHARLRELELVCDGVAVLTLHRIGVPTSALIDGLRTMTNSNWSNGLEEVDGRSYPTLLERAQFARLVTP